MSENWTAEELRNLALLFPENVTKDSHGRPFATITREEARNLLAAYPSMLPEAPPEVPKGEDPALVAKYPSMYRKK